ncbi:MAG: diaminopimelate epimerase [Prevotellaceae bacterium]|jgi:diaminopimelate epimerase|nr:diaminopimelate epimerase [Prevotellaceae bacterium]
MKLHFYKYQGAGNDFVIIDGKRCVPELSPKIINNICDRRFGIGADGVMVIGNDPDVDFTMRYYNADGNEGSMCGNGGRCLAAFAAGVEKERLVFSAVDGIHHAKVVKRFEDKYIIQLKMNDVNHIELVREGGFFLDTGSPHLLFFGTDIAAMDVKDRGSFWRNHPDFAPKGTNVNFVEVVDGDSLFVRTFERGVEDETFACGTGVTAAAIAAYVRSIHWNMSLSKGIHTYCIKTLGGDLQVSFQAEGMHFSDVQLTGPATFVFEGDIML